MTGTVRFRVTALATLAVALVLGVTSVVLVTRQRAGLIEQLDDSLRQEADRLGRAGELRGLGDDDLSARIVDANGAVVAETAGFADGDGHRVAEWAMPSGGTVLVSSPLEDIDEIVRGLIASLLWIGPLATVVLAAVVWLLVGRTLGPVERIRSEVAGIGLGDLDRRVPQPPGRDEIARLATTMNEMLERLQRSNRRQQRFVADASHELRTPLTRLRVELELASADGSDRHVGREAAIAADVTHSALDEIDGLQRLIDDLLLLTRGDAGALTIRREPVDLDDIVLEEARARRASAVVIETSRVSAAQVAGQGDLLRRVVRNLLDNAIRHAATTVTLQLAERNGAAVLTVGDDGPGIAPERRAEVFERFTRLDEARSGGSGRAGLGLAIVHDLVTRHGGSIVIDGDESGGARFVVTLPRPDP